MIMNSHKRTAWLLIVTGAALAEGDGGSSGGGASGGGSSGGDGGGSGGGSGGPGASGGAGTGGGPGASGGPGAGGGYSASPHHLSSPPGSAGLDARAARQAEGRGEAKSLPTILKSLSRVAPGRVLTVIFEQTSYGFDYAFTVLTEDGHYLDVVLDARTARLISARTR